MAVDSRLGAMALLAACCILAGGCARSAEGERTAREALRRGDATQALALARKAAQECPPNSACLWSARLMEAEVLLRDNQSDAAERLLVQEPPRTVPFRALAARRVWLLGFLAFNRQNMRAAEDYLDQAIGMASAVGDWDVVFEAQARLAQLLFLSRNDRERAAALFRQIADAASGRKNPYYEAIAANGLGMMNLKGSRFDEGIPWFQRTIEAGKAGGGQRLEVAALQNLAICYAQLGDFDSALNSQREAIQLSGQAAFSPYRMELLGGMGNMYLHDDVPRAIGYFQQALALAKTDADIARWHRTISAAYASIGDWDHAEQHNNLAMTRQNDDASRVWAEKNAAQIAAGRGKRTEAEALYKQIIVNAPDTPELTWEAHAALAQLSVEAGKPREANREFAAAIDVINKNADRISLQDYKLSFLSNLYTFYRNYVRALISQGDVDRALEVADSSRARSLVQRLALRRPSGSFSRDYVGIARDTGSVLLFYWVAPDKSYLWAVTAQGIQRPIEIPPAEQIRRLVEEYRKFVEEKVGDPMAGTNEAGRNLYDTLIAPAARWISPGSRVIIFPDDALNWLNFETLPVYEGAPGKTPHFWIEDVRVAVAPCLGVMRADRRMGVRPGNSLLIIGDPVSPGDEYPKLPYAAQEIQAIKASCPRVETKEFTGALARPAVYKASSPGRYSLLHFSTHAIANKESPLDSAIILSPDGGSFKLYARDIMDTPLTADLVTISACRTAGARSYSGEGLVGFAWAFLGAGARNVIAGLWDVTDRSTPQIMSVIYSQLARGSQPSDALRQAKLALIHSGTAYRKPYYWGPFQLYTR